MPPSFLFFFQKDSTSTKGEGTRRVSISSSAHRRTVSSGEKYSDVVTGLIKLEIEDKQYANETHWYVTGTFRCLEPAWTPSRWSLKSVLWCRWKKKKSLAVFRQKRKKKVPSKVGMYGVHTPLKQRRRISQRRCWAWTHNTYKPEACLKTCLSR